MTPAPIVVADDELIDAITSSQLSAWAADHDSPIARDAMQTCTTIGDQVAADADDVARWLRRRGLDVTMDEVGRPRQRHELTVEVSTFERADEVARALTEQGFERWERWSRGAERSFRHHADQITVVRAGDHSFVLRVRWRPAPSGGRTGALMRSVFRPTRGDWTMVSLPTRLWPLYSVVRPVRLVLERIGLRDPHAAGLGPFLSTPRSVIGPLLELAGVGPTDTLLDVGCGDGRLVITAAETIGCRAVGVELDADLADRARRNAADAGVSELVEIVCGDARDVDTTGFTATFMFLPIDVLDEMVAAMVDRLAPGGHLVVHEQNALPRAVRPRPDSSYAVIATDAVTVAHVWRRT